uniref:type I restriction-modification system subunit M N-terminal domain-containing protein n=1 Tax=Alloprevotella sp. TaxID=1872471 RepID=UPI003FEF2434
MCETSLLTNKPQNSYGKKAIKSKPQKSMEEALGESCNKMRGSVEPSEYKHVVLSLIFLKYAGDQVAMVQTQDHSLTLCLAKYSKHLNCTKGN